MAALSELMDLHASLHEALAVHRDRVVGLEFTRAAEALEAFARDLRRHIEDEETRILPLYEARVPSPPRGGRAEYFRLEHQRILALLDELLTEARELARDPAAGARQAHEFLHRQGPLLHILDHHETRERAILYPELDRRVGAEESSRILAQCLRADSHGPATGEPAPPAGGTE